jgi:hypothetical protein
MNMDEIRKMHQQKEHLMRHEGKHPANYSRADYAVEDPNSHREFSENNGDSPNAHLSLQRKNSRSNDRIPNALSDTYKTVHLDNESEMT